MATGSCYPDKAPKVDRLFDTLSDHLRREVIHYFENRDGTATSDELVSHVATRVPHLDHDEVEALLWHRHLPQLREHGWLDVDYRTDTIRYHGHDSARQWVQEMHDVFAADGDAT